MKVKTQRQFDTERATFLLIFPNELPADRVEAVFRMLSTSTHAGVERIFGMKSIVFETWASRTGIQHRVILPRQIADHVTSQMRHLVPGLLIEPDKTRPRPNWDYGVELGMAKKNQQLMVGDAADMSTSILTAVGQALTGNEQAVLQWVIAPTVGDDFDIFQSLLSREPSNEVLADRKKKSATPNFLAVARIGSKAGSISRAKHVVQGIRDVLSMANGGMARLRSTFHQPEAVTQRINAAVTPMLFPAMLNVQELTALSGFTIGSPFVPGVPRTAGRHMYATEEVARTGRVLGKSNYPGHSRPIALDYKNAALHSYIGGRSGSGKSTLMANWISQDMENGFGVIVIDASNSNSGETLFSRTLDYIPRHRLEDAIILDVNQSRDFPVGFNILDQGDDYIVVDQFASLIQQLYPDSRGVWTRELIHHGLYALIDSGNGTLMDLLTLLRPKSEEDRVWARTVTRNVKDERIRQFWEEWALLKEEKRMNMSQALYDRLWQFNNRPELHNILGQTKSSFTMREVLQGNKILLINLAGLPEETGALIGTLLFQSLWTAAQTMTPNRGNFVYLDEVQQMTQSSTVGLDDIMARGRKHKFALTVSTQFLDGSKLSDGNKAAIVNNTGTQVIFNTSRREANLWSTEFGRHVSAEDFTTVRKYDAYAKISNDTGNGEPVSFTADPPRPPIGLSDTARNLSRIKYGKPVVQVEDEIRARRRTGSPEKSKRPNFGSRSL